MFSPTQESSSCLRHPWQGDEVSQRHMWLHRKQSLNWALGIFHSWCRCSLFGIVCIPVSMTYGRCSFRVRGVVPLGCVSSGCRKEGPYLPQGPQPALTWLWLIRAMSSCACLFLSKEHLSKLNLQTRFCTFKFFRSKILRKQPLVHCFS